MKSTNHDPGDLLARYQAGFNLLGRLTILQAAKQKTGKRLHLVSGSKLFSAAGDEAEHPDAAIEYSFQLPSSGAIDYLRNLTPVTREIFDGLTRQYRADALTIAGVNDQRLIEKVRDALGEVLTEGGTAADFRRIVNHLTDQAGAAQISAFAIDTVFNTNVQKAYSQGRFEQMTDEATVELLPFWEFWTVGDDRVRPEHRVLDGFTARAIDPVWRKIYPPCGFNCRCSVVPLMENEAPENASESGLLRLPLLAQLKVPQPGFTTILAAA